MKNFNLSEIQDWTHLSNEFNTELKQIVVDSISAEHTTLGKCTIDNLSLSCSEAGLLIIGDFHFDGQSKKLCLNTLMAKGLIKLNEPELTELSKFVVECSDIRRDFYDIMHDRRVEKFEADRQAKELAKQEAKRKALEEKGIHDFEVLTKRGKDFCASGEFHYALGWLAKNIGTISAALPDYLLPSFENHFGPDVKPTVVDSNKRTVNGNPMQWGLSMKATISKKALDNIPPILKQYLNTSGNTLTNTHFIWDLIETYGFSFGKNQDKDQIESNIPAHLIEPFEKGYAA